MSGCHDAYRLHNGYYNHELFADCLRIFKAIRALRPNQFRAQDPEGLDAYYKGNLVEKSGDLFSSIEASITRFLDPKFAGSTDFPLRNLQVALRDEPALDPIGLGKAAAPYLPSLFKLAIRNHFKKSGNLFVDPDTPNPKPEQYWSEVYQSNTVSEGSFALQWGRDHTTAGLTITIRSTTVETDIVCRSYPAMMDWLYLIENTLLGGTGGSRGDFTFELNTGFTAKTGGAFVTIGKDSGYSKLWLPETLLTELQNATSAMLSDPKINDAKNQLCWIYGDI